MINDLYTGSGFDINLIPKCGPCYNFKDDDFFTKRTVWLVPHVIKNKDESQIITWRCNWGNVCKSECVYSMIKDASLQSLKSNSVDALV